MSLSEWPSRCPETLRYENWKGTLVSQFSPCLLWMEHKVLVSFLLDSLHSSNTRVRSRHFCSGWKGSNNNSAQSLLSAAKSAAKFTGIELLLKVLLSGAVAGGVQSVRVGRVQPAIRRDIPLALFSFRLIFCMISPLLKTLGERMCLFSFLKTAFHLKVSRPVLWTDLI